MSPVDSYMIILYRFDSHEPGPTGMRSLHEYLYRNIPNGARITIIGSDDDLGPYQANPIERQRAQAVYTLIRKNVREQSIGSITWELGNRETSPHDLPEVRVFMRGVVVMVER